MSTEVGAKDYLFCGSEASGIQLSDNDDNAFDFVQSSESINDIRCVQGDQGM